MTASMAARATTFCVAMAAAFAAGETIIYGETAVMIFSMVAAAMTG